MSVTVPAGEKTGAYLLQQQITSLSSRTDAQSVQLKAEREADLVATLLDQNRLSAAAILATYTGNRNPLATRIATLTTLAAGTTAAANGAAAELAAVQKQAVLELMANGQLTGAAILAGQSYGGGAAR